jgi:cupin 2 domain-containing protein
MDNFFSVNNKIDFSKEIFIELFKNNNCVIEKIISTGQCTKENEWLEEDEDEWVILLQGTSELKFFNGEYYKMKAGNYLLIPSNTKHRVEATSVAPQCVWLAIHIKSNK